MQVVHNATGKIYQVVEEALNKSNCETMIIYRDSEKTYCREKTEFWSKFSTPLSKLVKVFTELNIDHTVSENSIIIYTKNNPYFNEKVIFEHENTVKVRVEQ